MPLRTGIGATTYQEYMIGPGAVYYNWVSAAAPGTLLGETKGGNTFEVIPTFHEYEPDGSYGHVEDHTVISAAVIRLTANLYGVTIANILRVLPGSQADNYELVHVPAEYIGKATAGADAFTPLGAGAIIFSSLKVYEDAGGGLGPTLLVKDTNYTVNTANGLITEVGVDGYTTDSYILVEYDYDKGGGDTLSIITLNNIVTGDELSNIAIVGEISDVDKTKDAVLVVENALCMNGLTLALPGGNREAVVMPAIFEGHWATSDLKLSAAPFKIVYDLA